MGQIYEGNIIKNFKNMKMQIQILDINDVFPNKNQPRKEFDKQALKSLSDSINQHGMLHPIIVSKKEWGYMIISGERRYKAARLLGLEKIPCIIGDFAKEDIMELALVENLQRSDLNPIEEALGYKDLIDKHNMTQDKIGNIVGKSRSYIANTIRLLNLEKEVIDSVSSKKISAGHARILLQLEGKKQLDMMNWIVSENASVRELESKIKKENKTRRNTTQKKDPFINAFQEKLSNVFQTKVKIQKGRKKGKIEIEYYGEENLEEILKQLLGKNYYE